MRKKNSWCELCNQVYLQLKFIAIVQDWKETKFWLVKVCSGQKNRGVRLTKKEEEKKNVNFVEVLNVDSEVLDAVRCILIVSIFELQITT